MKMMLPNGELLEGTDNPLKLSIAKWRYIVDYQKIIAQGEKETEHAEEQEKMA